MGGQIKPIKISREAALVCESVFVNQRSNFYMRKLNSALNSACLRLSNYPDEKNTIQF